MACSESGWEGAEVVVWGRRCVIVVFGVGGFG